MQKRSVTLNNGVEMPLLGLGVWQAGNGEELEQAIVSAAEYGYRSIDTASVYGNEEGVGRAIQKTGIPREQFFVTTKLWNIDHGYDSTLKAFEKSRERLGLDYVDLYLIHWPVMGMNRDTWCAMEQLYEEGKVRAIGVSNFLEHHLLELMETSRIQPAVNQIEYHPSLASNNLHLFCKQHFIQLEAYSPLMRGRLMDHPLLLKLASRYGKSVAQIILRWVVQQDIVTVPKSISPVRIRENADIFDFELSEEDMVLMAELNVNQRVSAHPDHRNF